MRKEQLEETVEGIENQFIVSRLALLKVNKKKHSINYYLLKLGVPFSVVYAKPPKKSNHNGQRTIYHRLGEEEIKELADKGRRKLLTTFHPDRFQKKEDIELGKRICQEVTEAYSYVMKFLKGHHYLGSRPPYALF